jgi:hypothetical protein
VKPSLPRLKVIVLPKQPVLDWLHSVDPASTDIALENLHQEPTLYLLAESESDEDAESLLAKSCARIFEEQLDGWHSAPESWPEDRSIENFRRWFTFSFHSMIVDLCEDPLIADEIG